MNQKTEPLVSLIIVNYNGKNYLQKCIDSILQNNYSNYEIIVVDNNSEDGSIDYIKKNSNKIKLIELEKNYGYAKPNNMGSKIAKGDFLFFLNNDTTIYDNTIEELVKSFQNPEIGICQSLLLHPDKSIDSAGDYVNYDGIPFSSKKHPLGIKHILSARGAGMMMRRDIFWEMLGFDEKFFVSFEDVDIGWRSWLWGYKVLLVPSSIVIHKGGITVKKLSEEIKFHGVKNFLILNFVYFERPIILSLIKLLIGFFTKKISKNFKSKNDNLFVIPKMYVSIRAFFWILKNLNYILDKKKLINSKRKLSTDDLIKMKLIRENC